MNIIRAATQEEVDKIRETSDLTPESIVVALDTPNGPILGVIRIATEVDPVYFPQNCDDRHKLVFIRDMSNFLLGRGNSSFYFNIHDTPELKSWRDAIEKNFAERVSPVPVIRYKRELFKVL